MIVAAVAFALTLGLLPFLFAYGLHSSNDDDWSLDGVAALQGGVQAGDWVGHGRTPGSDVVNIRERGGRRKQNRAAPMGSN